ncbi:hypothetical protein KOW79_006102 [Hemibagrus wyckioides]|uniref:Uncharacterized protein n=1 Tax=Hemibagrus wyckioides TaxID=337641 RepID=A0A9D3NZ59_9TELE|nr:uncharacterized protein LOC131355539 isoform X2 [Hemibagrus wyckioides]KAG7329880.1 hypothetical protein KOW79_006102 [Hemibagrus wyckioides]
MEDKLGAQGFCKGSNHSDTDPLLFGKPITLRVEPNVEINSPPLLSILSSIGGEDSCLAAGFSPKAGTLSLITASSIVNHTVNRAVLSNQKTYYFAAFSENINECHMNSIKAYKTEEKPTATTANCEKTNTVTDSMSDTQSNNSTEIVKPETKSYSGDPKGNTMQLIVTGLRLLLAKAVGVNILMTLKAFLV